MHKRIGKIIGSIFVGFIGLLIFILIGGQIFLNTTKMKNLVLEMAAEYVDGDINIRDLKISLFKNFPNLCLSMSDFSLTYPHNQYEIYSSLGPQHNLREAGRGNQVDTLASFSQLSISLNYVKALSGCLTIPEASLDSARIHLHCYDSLHTNLDILKWENEENEEDSTSSLPHIVVKKVMLEGHPQIHYTSLQDSLFASFSLEKATFDGLISTRMAEQSKLDFELDHLLATAQLAEIKTKFGISSLQLKQKGEDYHLKTDGAAQVVLNKKRQLDIPLHLETDFIFPKRNLTTFSFRDFELGVATLNLTGEGDIQWYADSTYIRSELQIADCQLNEMITWLGKSMMPDLLKIKTNAAISMTALCDGYYIPAKKKIPSLLLEVELPEADIAYDGIDKKGKMGILVNAETDDYGTLNLSIDELKADLAGIYLNGKAEVEDLLSEDPLFSVKAKLKTSLDTLITFLPDTLGLEASGNIEGQVDGLFFQSDMNFFHFSGADLTGEIKSDQIHLSYPPQNISAYLKNPRISLKPTDEKLDDRYALGNEIQAVYVEIDSVFAQYGSDQFIRGKDLSAIAQNAASIESKQFGQEYHPIIAQVSAKTLVSIMPQNTFAGVINSKNLFKLSNRKKGDHHIPLLSAESNNEKIILRQESGRIGLSNTDIQMTALMEKKVNATDSLVKKEWTEYLKDWFVYGSLKMENGFFMTPYFPLRNHFENISGSFNNHEIQLKNFTIHSGISDLTAKGKVSGIKKALLEDQALKMELDVTSNKIDLNELLTAYHSGAQFIESIQSNQATDENLTDEEYMKQIITDTVKTETDQNFMFMIPDKIEAKVNLNANEISYSDLKTDWAASEIAIKNQCLQITNTLATSNMGDIYFEGFYSSEKKQELKAGFDLNLASITADKVITLFPAVDSIMPMLKSFKGILDCELAAVTDLDTCLNVKTNTINGVMKIKGKDLSLDNIGPLKKLARTLMFKNKETGIIDDMSVEGLILNDELQVFPFVMKIDRYQFAASGIQQFDQNFKYHVSVLKSPLPFRFGINLKGNFDDWKFKIGKAKYKSARVPVFTHELNNIQVNLVNSIHDIFNKGVDLAVKVTEKGSQEIEKEKKKQGIILEEEPEELTLEEQIELEGAIIENEVEENIEKELKTKSSHE